MKKILFITSSRLKAPIRGTPLRIYNILRQIKKQHELHVCAVDVEPDLEDKFIAYPKLGGWKKLRYFKNLVREKKIDVVMTATETGIKLPVFLQWVTGVKIAIDLHGLYSEERQYKGAIGQWRKFFYQKMINFFLRFYDLIFVVSGKLRDFYQRINSKIVVIYGGYNPDEFTPSQSPPIHHPKKEYLFGEPRQTGGEGERVFTIGYMGNTRNYQGLDSILEAASAIKQKNLFRFRLRLLVSGDRQELLGMLKQKGLADSADLSFDIPHDQVYGIIRHTDVLTIPRPSLPMTEYAYPSKLPEYLATGVPIILSAVGPVGELLDGQNFCIIIGTERISEELEEALARVWKMSPEERSSMGRAAIDFVKNNLTWNRLGDKINQAIGKL